MTELQTTVRTLNRGDTVRLGDIVESEVRSTGGGARILALHRGEVQEYVVVSARFSDDDEISVPDGAEILDITEGSGMGSPQCWMLIPVEEYGA